MLISDSQSVSEQINNLLQQLIKENANLSAAVTQHPAYWMSLHTCNRQLDQYRYNEGLNFILPLFFMERSTTQADIETHNTDITVSNPFAKRKQRPTPTLPASLDEIGLASPAIQQNIFDFITRNINTFFSAKSAKVAEFDKQVAEEKLELAWLNLLRTHYGYKETSQPNTNKSIMSKLMGTRFAPKTSFKSKLKKNDDDLEFIDAKSNSSDTDSHIL